MKLYLGGKMAELPGFGFREFDAAALVLHGLGHEVFNPAERDRLAGFNPHPRASSHRYLRSVGFDRREALRVDLDWIMTESEGMVALPSWPDSPGTRAEVAAHQSIFLPVWEYTYFAGNDDFPGMGVNAPVLLPLVSGGMAFMSEMKYSRERPILPGGKTRD